MFLKLGQRQLSCAGRCLNRVGACKGNATCWCMHSNLFELKKYVMNRTAYLYGHSAAKSSRSMYIIILSRRKELCCPTTAEDDLFIFMSVGPTPLHFDYGSRALFKPPAFPSRILHF
ncbi:uncharacterized protein [Physcomitrium patens]|uniref:uncharacterized protein n=1 Tax=Physcomitrium patens TaxID=3218 RepID=UPI003CCD31D2